MTDTARHDALRTRATRLRERAEGMHHRLVQAHALQMQIQVFVINPAADVTRFFLGPTLPSDPTCEHIWLTNAEIVLRAAEEQLMQYEKLIAECGGPEHVQLT